MTTAKPMPISIRVFLSRFIVFPPLGQTDYRKSILGNDWFSIRISLKRNPQREVGFHYRTMIISLNPTSTRPAVPGLASAAVLALRQARSHRHW